MKHGDKAKSKASKASGKKASTKAAGKVSKAGPPPKSKSSGAEKASPKASKTISKAPGNGKSAGRGEGGFTNPVVANAFKRAIKKYPNAFRRLTD